MHGNFEKPRFVIRTCTVGPDGKEVHRGKWFCVDEGFYEATRRSFNLPYISPESREFKGRAVQGKLIQPFAHIEDWDTDLVEALEHPNPQWPSSLVPA